MKPPKDQEFGDGCIELDESEFTMEVFRRNGEAMKVVPLSEYKKLQEENNAKDQRHGVPRHDDWFGITGTGSRQVDWLIYAMIFGVIVGFIAEYKRGGGE